VAEARAVNQIRHRNIIDIFSFGQLPDGRHYYVMEYIDGEPLDRRIDRGRLSLHEALPILRPIARALDTAHGKGIAHRDLKAENVFLGADADGSVFPKLLDFGIAKLMGPEDGVAHKTRTGAPMGTPYYMSPEQTKGRGVDHKTDHYAFGVLVYLMLTGKYPLDADDYMTILMRQIHDEPEPASKHVPDLPAGVDDTIAWLMRKAPEERPPDLMTAVRALEQAAGIAPADSARVSAPIRVPTAITRTSGKLATASMGGAATVAAPSEPVPPVKPPTERQATLWIVLTAVGLLAVVVVLVIATRGPDKPETPAGSGSAPVAQPPPPALDAAVATASADAAPSIDAASANVTVTITGAPANTPVRVGGHVVGTVPKLQVERGTAEVMLVFDADGFQPLTLTITPDRDQQHTVKLKPKTGSTRPRPPRGSGSSDEPTNDIEDFPKR
jgi:eukaryotic-like serine/threonine-protein kinase